jgi:putative PIN family toxin of toxin-antitoxin system
MIRVVLDTSVLVSAVISPTGPNAQVFDLVTEGTIRPYLTEAVLAEYYRVFEYERLRHLDRRRIARLRGLLESVSVKVKSARPTPDLWRRRGQPHLRMRSCSQSRLHRH